MSGTCECSLIPLSISCSCLHTHWHILKVNFSIDFPIKSTLEFICVLYIFWSVLAFLYFSMLLSASSGFQSSFVHYSIYYFISVGLIALRFCNLCTSIFSPIFLHQSCHRFIYLINLFIGPGFDFAKLEYGLFVRNIQVSDILIFFLNFNFITFFLVALAYLTCLTAY